MQKFFREKLFICVQVVGEPMGAMMRIANHTHPDVLLRRKTVIFSSKIIPGNEKII